MAAGKRRYSEEFARRVDTLVESKVRPDAALTVQPITPEALALDELLQGVTDENLPGEWHTGPDVGKEVW